MSDPKFSKATAQIEFVEQHSRLLYNSSTRLYVLLENVQKFRENFWVKLFPGFFRENDEYFVLPNALNVAIVLPELNV